MLKNRYETTQAFGLVDLGAMRDSGRFTIVELDTNNDGKIDESEKQAVKANLYTLALQGGGIPLKDERGRVVSVNQCINMGIGNSAQDDSVLVFDKGAVIRPTETDMSFAAIHFLLDNGYLK